MAEGSVVIIVSKGGCSAHMRKSHPAQLAALVVVIRGVSQGEIAMMR